MPDALNSTLCKCMYETKGYAVMFFEINSYVLTC